MVQAGHIPDAHRLVAVIPDAHRLVAVASYQIPQDVEDKTSGKELSGGARQNTWHGLEQERLCQRFIFGAIANRSGDRSRLAVKTRTFSPMVNHQNTSISIGYSNRFVGYGRRQR
jgi:hypothetical protein